MVAQKNVGSRSVPVNQSNSRCWGRGGTAGEQRGGPVLRRVPELGGAEVAHEELAQRLVARAVALEDRAAQLLVLLRRLLDQHVEEVDRVPLHQQRRARRKLLQEGAPGQRLEGRVGGGGEQGKGPYSIQIDAAHRHVRSPIDDAPVFVEMSDPWP